MRIGLIAMCGIRVRTKELAELGVALPQFANRGKVIASLVMLLSIGLIALPTGIVSSTMTQILQERRGEVNSSAGNQN